MRKCKHPLTSLVKGNTGYFCKECGNRVDDEVAKLILEAKELGRSEAFAQQSTSPDEERKE